MIAKQFCRAFQTSTRQFSRNALCDALALTAETKRKAQVAEQQQKEKYLDSTVECPLCDESRLNVYKFKINQYLCKFQACGIYGTDTDFSSALHQSKGAIGNDIDWRDGSLFTNQRLN